MKKHFLVSATVALTCLLGIREGVAQNAYITDFNSGTVSVIDTTQNAVIGSPIPVGRNPYGVAVTPDGSTAYVANLGSGTVSVIDTGTNTVIGTPITDDSAPTGVAVSPNGTRVYVASSSGT